MSESLLDRAYQRLRRELFPSPVQVRHAFYSMVYSEDDSPSRPSQRLMDVSLQSIANARQNDLSELSARTAGHHGRGGTGEQNSFRFRRRYLH
jgi:hypothetical protein